MTPGLAFGLLRVVGLKGVLVWRLRVSPYYYLAPALAAALRRRALVGRQPAARHGA